MWMEGVIQVKRYIDDVRVLFGFMFGSMNRFDAG